MAESDNLPQTYNWKDLFTHYRFRPTEWGGMKGRVEDIDIVAVEHPFKGVSVMASHIDARTATEFETFIAKEISLQDFGKLFIYIIEQIHPEMVRKPEPEAPPVPERKRPSNEEALAKVPDLIRQFYAVLDEISFLFQRPTLVPEGYLDQKTGEVIAAYVYDLELTRIHSDFSEAKSSDGRRVQVRTTRAQASRETVALHSLCEHLLVVQLWGREVIEVYNGPLEPIWAAAKRVQKNGTRRISMGRLRGHNKYVVPAEQTLERKRTWKFDSTVKDYDDRL